MTSFLRRDLPVLFLVSVLLGTLAARTISFAADVYFRETITSMVGEYGEYDLFIQLREENKAEALAELSRILAAEFPGAVYKEGPALVQKVSVFIALPDEYKSRELYESIEKRFHTIPGGVGISIITEPRLIVRGLPPGVQEALISRFSALPGVLFAYQNGASLGLVIHDSRQLQAITQAVEAELGQTKLLEISFAKGLEPSDPKLTAERLSSQFKAQAGLEASYVSLDKGSDDLSRLIGVMREMQGFLEAYRTKLFIRTEVPLESGTLLALPTQQAAALSEGSTFLGQAIARVEYLKRAGIYQAVLVQGDSSELVQGTAYMLSDSQLGAPVGTISWHNPRNALLTAADDAMRIVTDTPSLRAASQRISEQSVQLFAHYESNQPLLRRTLDHMAAAEQVLLHSADKLQLLSGQETQARLNASIDSLGQLTKSLRIISWFHADTALALENLKAVRQRIIAVRDVLASADELGDEARRAGDILRMMQSDMETLNGFLGNLQRADIEKSAAALEAAIGNLDQTEAQAVIEALQLLQSNLPLLRDDDIAASLSVIDKLISGQAIPDKRLQFKVARTADKEALRPLIAQTLGHTNFNVFEAELGIIEPNVYAQAFQILNEVHSVLAALTAFTVTIVFLALDHTAIAAALKWRCAGWCGIVNLGNVYCTLSGGLLLSSIYWLSGASIPYVSLVAVALLGSGLGLIFGLTAEKFSPLYRDEMLAAESLGLDFTAILREIVLPAGRPGLAVRLNRLRQKFK